MKSAFGHIALEPRRVCLTAFWIDAPRDGFTALCATTLGKAIPVDEVSTEALQAWQRRADLLATVEAVKQGKQTGAVRRASVELQKRKRDGWKATA